MANFFAYYPSSSGAANPSVGPNGSPIPADSTLIGFDVAGILEPVSSANPLPVAVVSSPTPQNVNISQYGGVATTLGQKVSASSMPVVLASDEIVPISASSLPLPTGASTSALQVSGNSILVTVASNQTNGTQVTAINNFPATQPVSGTVIADQGAAGVSAWLVDGSGVTQPISAVSLPLPTGASTSALQTAGNTSLASIDSKTPPLGQAASAASVPVVIASDQSPVPVASNLGTFIDQSGTTSVTPSTSTTLMVANASRKYMIIENVDPTATIWINFTSAATAGSGSIEIVPTGSYTMEGFFISTEAVTVLSTVASAMYTAKEA